MLKINESSFDIETEDTLTDVTSAQNDRKLLSLSLKLNTKITLNHPPTKNGHAPPPTESRKSYQSVNPSSVRAW